MYMGLKLLPFVYERHQDASGLIERSGIILSRMNSTQVP